MQALGVSWGDRKGRRRAVVAMATATALLVPGVSGGAGEAHASVLQQVIVQALPGAFAHAEAAVQAAGGTVKRELSLINGFSANLPSDARLGSDNGILAVTPDRAMHLQGGSYAPATDVGAPLAVQTALGASSYYQNGLYGQGVGVALVDSGIVPEDGLHNNVFYGPDFTPQAADPSLNYLDTFGHGTFMAGLIAGRTDAATRPYSDPANYTGIAPEATLVSLKVADALGNTTESSVVGAVDWATEHMTDKGLNIRVLNLSLGSPNAGYANDPLAAAVERAWSFGLTVVTAAGNDGKAGLDLPAADPYTIAVGAIDNQNTAALGDDKVASFSNTGTGRNPDFVAPGTHIVGLRDAGSFIDNTFGLTGLVSSTLFRGSGTSEAAAITSGAAALVISQHPGITPDQVRGILAGTARSIPGSTWETAGAGALNLGGAYGAAIPATTTTAAHANGYASFSTALWGGSWSGNVWTSAQHQDTLLSQGRLATASSYENTTVNAASMAVDGDATTRWSSAFSDNQWLEVDLGASATIDSVTLNWEAAYGKAFQIQTSTDNVNWKTIYSTTSGAGGVQKLAVTGTGRYVRMYGTTRGTTYGFSLFEFQVYGAWTPQVCTTADAAVGKSDHGLVAGERHHRAGNSGDRRQRWHPLGQRGCRRPMAPGRPRLGAAAVPGDVELGDRVRLLVPDPVVERRHQLGDALRDHLRRPRPDQRAGRRRRPLRPDVRDRPRHAVRLLALVVRRAHRAVERSDHGRRGRRRQPVEQPLDRLGLDRLGLDGIGVDRLGLDRLGLDRLDLDRELLEVAPPPGHVTRRGANWAMPQGPIGPGGDCPRRRRHCL